MADDDLLTEAKEAYELIVDVEAENRNLARGDLLFGRLGEQWPHNIRQRRERESRATLTINKFPAFIRQVVNDARQMRPQVKVYPVDSNADMDTAEIIGGMVRSIEQQSNADLAYDGGVDYAVSCGMGYWRVDVDYSHDGTFDQDVKILRIDNPLAVYGDPYDRGADSSNWNSAFITEPVPREVFEQKYPDAEAADWDDQSHRRLETPWFDSDHVMLAEWWKRDEEKKTLLLLSDGTTIYSDIYERDRALWDMIQAEVVQSREVMGHKVKHYVMSGAEILEDEDWPGRFIPIVPVYGEEINIDGRRYYRSLIRDAIDAQRMYNYWRSASTELVALAPKAPWTGPEEAFEGKDGHKWETANTDNWSYMSYQGDVPPQRQGYTGPPIAQMQEALAASDDMKAIMGMYDASLGQRSNETSGIAIENRQREGDVSTFHFLDNLSRAIRHSGEVVVDLIPHVYAPGRIVRTLGMDGTVENIELGERREENKDLGLSAVYDVSVGKYDVVVDAGPSYTTRRQEAADQMMQLLRYFPQAAPVIGDLLVKNLDWPGAEEIADRLRALIPGLQNDDEDPRLVMAMQVIEQLRAQLEMAQDDRDIELMKAKIDAYDAESKRITAESNAMKAVTGAGKEVVNLAGMVGRINPPGPYDQWEQ